MYFREISKKLFCQKIPTDLQWNLAWKNISIENVVRSLSKIFVWDSDGKKIHRNGFFTNKSYRNFVENFSREYPSQFCQKCFLQISLLEIL